MSLEGRWTDKGIDRLVAHTVFSLEAKNLVSSKAYWDSVLWSFSGTISACQSSQEINLVKVSRYNDFSLHNFCFGKLIAKSAQIVGGEPTRSSLSLDRLSLEN